MAFVAMALAIVVDADVVVAWLPLSMPRERREKEKKKRENEREGPLWQRPCLYHVIWFFFPSHNKFKITILHLGSIPKEVLHENQPQQLQNHQASYTPWL